MKWVVVLFVAFCSLLSGIDYDCIFIGSSPFSLFDALYQSHSGKSVLILEQASCCGGAWKSIEICGIPRADLGCHQIGADLNLKDFLETYAGCHIVSMDNPWKEYDRSDSPNGFYFSQGCYELVDHLMKLIEKTPIVVSCNEKVETVTVDEANQMAIVQTDKRSFTASKVIVTPMSGFDLNDHGMSFPGNQNKVKYYHLYLLVQDPAPSTFTYRGGTDIMQGISRVMNLTHFVGLDRTGMQLLVFQTHSESVLNKGNEFLDSLKNKGMIGSGAYILKEEPYIFESIHLNSQARQPNVKSYVEILDTGHIQNLANYISKWKPLMKPYSEIIPASP